MSGLFICESDQLMQRFYSDIVQSSIFEQEISFLEHYNNQKNQYLNNYSTVLKCQEFIQRIIQTCIKNSAEKLNQIKNIVSQYIQIYLKEQQQQMTEQEQLRIINSLGSVIYNRLQEISKKYLLDCLSMGSMHLIDINWKVMKIISSNARTFMNSEQNSSKLPYLIKATLILKQRETSKYEKSLIKTLTLQMNKIQLKQLIGQLKTVKKQFI